MSSKTVLSFPCPHCGLLFEVLESELRCRIFRHAVMRADMKQLNPHAPKVECDRVVREGLVFGCAKPFRIDGDPKSGYRVSICGYI